MTTPSSMPPPTLPPERQDPPPLSYDPPRRLDYVGVGPEQNGTAVAALICGVLVFVPYVAGVAAILLGRRGLLRAGELSGRGRGKAKAAVVLGVINLALSVLLTAAAFPAMAHARRKANEMRCASNLRQLSVAMLMYAQDNRGFLPPDFDAVQKYLGPPLNAAVVCTCHEASAQGLAPASVGLGTKYSYIFVPPPAPRLAQIGSPATVPAAYEPLANHGGRGINVVYWDGHVQWHPAPAAQRLIAQIQATQSALPQPAAGPTSAPATQPIPARVIESPLPRGGL